MERTELMNHLGPASRRQARVVRNERMTAFAGAILFVLILIELIVTANLHSLISVHIFIGIILSVPLIVKICSVGYRFFRYYTKSPAFVQKGPPNIWLRLLAPFLVVVTILVFVSGFGLALAGPTHMGFFFILHAASVALWLPLLAVHVYAYIRKVPRHIKSDWSKRRGERVSGRKGRLWLSIGSLVVGIFAAILMIPVSSQWSHWRIVEGLPSPLAAGVLAAIFAIIVAIPILRKQL